MEQIIKKNRVHDYEPKLYNDHFQNFKRYNIPKAQLIIADIPYNIGKDAYGSNPNWYEGGDNKNGESKLANTEFFDTDKDFRIAEFMHKSAISLLPEFAWAKEFIKCDADLRSLCSDGFAKAFYEANK